MNIKTLFAAAAAIAAAIALVACAAPGTPAQNTAGQSDISVKDAWARPTIGTGTSEGHSHGSSDKTMSGMNSAAYMVIENRGNAPDRLLSASGDVAATIEVHETKQKDGMMMMEAVKDGLEVPANGKVELKPAGYHIMLMDVKRELKPGDTFKLTLTFRSGKTVAVDVAVREP
ncbi:MAG: copper chaperone PCu(A)C [Anaerolineae bacterium]|nr:copper chaperone PCu(A)C [Anaerolineae bacterium]